MQDLTIQLKSLISDIETLIDLTYQDIDLIKTAQHDKVSMNNEEKNTLISRFESNKKVFNDLLMQITKNHPGKELGEILSHEEQELLDTFRQKLLQLHTANKIYAKFVVSLNEFFSSLVSAILPMKQEGYQTTKPKPAAFLQVSA